MNTKVIRIDKEKDLDPQLLEAAEVIKNGGLVDQALDNMASASGYDSPELRELWDQSGHDEIFDQYLDGENIFDIDYLYELIDNGGDGGDEEEND